MCLLFLLFSRFLEWVDLSKHSVSCLYFFVLNKEGSSEIHHSCQFLKGLNQDYICKEQFSDHIPSSLRQTETIMILEEGNLRCFLDKACLMPDSIIFYSSGVV